MTYPTTNTYSLKQDSPFAYRKSFQSSRFGMVLITMRNGAADLTAF